MATIAGGTIELSTDGTQLIFLENSTVPVTATWVGLGDRDDVLDPLNWQCLNANGTVLVGALPTVDTAITVSGETTFNLPTNQASQLVLAHNELRLARVRREHSVFRYADH